MSDRIKALWNNLEADIRQKVAESGQAVQIVHLSEGDPPDAQPFMYTIGNYACGLPELLIIGTDSHVIAGVLNRLGVIQRERGLAFANEELVSVGGKYPLRIIDTGPRGGAEYATFVGFYYGTRNYAVRQVLLPDTSGRWPDTPGCDLPYSRQPILSEPKHTWRKALRRWLN